MANVVVPVLAGVIAISSETGALISLKGGRRHVKAGWIFVTTYIALVITAMLGVAGSEFHSFLAVATIASSYDVWAGYRALPLQGRRPPRIEVACSLLALLVPLALVCVLRLLHQPWSPALTWLVLGRLMGLGAYDLCRVLLPAS